MNCCSKMEQGLVPSDCKCDAPGGTWSCDCYGCIVLEEEDRLYLLGHDGIRYDCCYCPWCGVAHPNSIAGAIIDE